MIANRAKIAVTTSKILNFEKCLNLYLTLVSSAPSCSVNFLILTNFVAINSTVFEQMDKMTNASAALSKLIKYEMQINQTVEWLHLL